MSTGRQLSQLAVAGSCLYRLPPQSLQSLSEHVQSSLAPADPCG